MAARKVAAATASATFSIATSAYISRSPATEGQSSQLQHFDLSEEVIERYLFVPDEFDDRYLETAQKILKETGDEIEDSFDQFKTTTVFEDAKVGAIVAARFVDLLSRSAVALLDYKLHYLLDQSDQKLSDVHQRTAKSLYEACASHGGLLVKFGQYLSNNAGTMVPAEYIEALKPLQDSCSPLPIEVIHECVEEELRKLCISRSEKGSSLIEQVFQEINPVPLGSASLAQVHAATLKDGRRVAIKVQRKHLATTTKADMIALHVLSRAIDRAFPGSGFEWMLPEFHQTITAELDFTQEAINAGRTSKMLDGLELSTGLSLWRFFSWRHTRSPKAIIPVSIKELTTDKMLTMSFEEGFKVTDTKKMQEHGIDRRNVAAAVCALFAELMLVHGFVYVDSHPGNVLVRPRRHHGVATGEFDIVLLDHGMYRRLDETYRSGYCNLWAGLVFGDDDQALKGIRELGLEDKFLDIMGLGLVYRVPPSLLGPGSPLTYQKLGFLMSNDAKKIVQEHIRKKFGDEISPASINSFVQQQSRDFLYCCRCTNLVRGLNLQLGGTTRDRFLAFGSAALRGANLNVCDNPITIPEAIRITDEKNDLLAKVKADLNRPVMSELVAARDMATAKTNDQHAKSRRIKSSTNINVQTILVTWWKGLFLDLLLVFTRANVDSNRQIG